MSLGSKRLTIQRINGSAIFIRMMITTAIVLGGGLWAAAMMIRFMKGA